MMHPSRLSRLTCLLRNGTTGIALCALLTGCGFQLRGQATLPFDTLYVAGTSPIANQIARAVRSGSQTRIASNPEDAHVTLEVLGEYRDRNILSLSSSGRVRELTLTYRVSYRLHNRKKNETISTADIQLRRELSYNDTDVIAKIEEEAQLFRDMQNDAVHQLVRRLQATRIDS
jgi:LPS-assembly lipoprotein